MANYILQVVLFQLLFLAIYESFLKRETFFHWNRFYLLFSTVLSYIIPFARIQLFKDYVPEQLAISNLNNLNFTTIATETHSNIVSKTNYFTLENLYYIGLAIMAVLFVIKILQLLYKINTNRVLYKPNYKLVLLQKEDNAFSFMDYIFLGKSLFKKEHQHILQHELVHVKEKHSLDLLFFEIQKILFWFNPLVYVYQYKISVLHEYIADQKTLKTTEKQSFYENLLLQTFAIEKLPFVNQYSKKSLLKKRIIMATKNKSNKLLKMKYLLVLPVIIFMLIVASCDNDNSTSQQETENIQPFSTIKKVPVFPGCENEETNKEKKKCFSSNMQKFVTENFNADLAQTLNLSEGMHKIAVQFIIDKQGNASDIKVRAPHPKLKDEVIRVINKLPKMQPAEDENGKKVKVRYNLPIVFKVEDDTKSEKTYIDIKKSAIFQSCKDLETEEQKRMCFKTELQKFVAENFNKDLTKGLGLSNGKQKILTQFKIDKQGNVIDVRAKAPHPKLKEEAIRVINKLPKMQPAEASDGKKVAMRYSLPIIFKVEESNSNENSSTLKYLKNAKTDLPPTPPSPPKVVNLLQDKRIALINGKIGEKVQLTKNEIKNAWIHPINNTLRVVSFKVKVPHKPTYFIKGDRLDNKIHNDILQAEKEAVIIIFDIKTQEGTKLNPIQFYVK